MNSRGKDKCKMHQTGLPEYQKINRLLKKIGASKTQTLSPDKLPVEQRKICKEKVSFAFEFGWPHGWGFLPATKRYIIDQNPGIDLSNLNDCIESLSPGFSKLIEKYDSAEDDIKALLTRAEAWLTIESGHKKSGGARKGAGRHPKDPKKNKGRAKEITMRLKEKRKKRQSSNGRQTRPTKFQ